MNTIEGGLISANNAIEYTQTYTTERLNYVQGQMIGTDLRISALSETLDANDTAAKVRINTIEGGLISANNAIEYTQTYTTERLNYVQGQMIGTDLRISALSETLDANDTAAKVRINTIEGGLISANNAAEQSQTYTTERLNYVQGQMIGTDLRISALSETLDANDTAAKVRINTIEGGLISANNAAEQSQTYTTERLNYVQGQMIGTDLRISALSETLDANDTAAKVRINTVQGSLNSLDKALDIINISMVKNTNSLRGDYISAINAIERVQNSNTERLNFVQGETIKNNTLLKEQNSIFRNLTNTMMGSLVASSNQIDNMEYYLKTELNSVHGKLNNTVPLTGGYITGALELAGDFDINTDKFTVASSTGNTTVAGTLDVSAITRLNATTSSTSTTTGALVVGGGVGIAENTYIGGNLIVTGDFTVSGTPTTINSTTLQVNDKNIEMGVVGTPTDTTADGGGITLKGATNKTIIWDIANENWTSNQNWNIATGKTFKINNVNVLSGDTLGDGVLYSSLTTVGILTGLTVDNLSLDANNITSSGALNLTPAVGSAIVLDGTISVDAGVVTGATSISSTTFVGNVTGNVTGTAATVTDAAQANITSVGTLTGLTVDNLSLDANNITSSGALNLTPAVGSAIVLDGTISVDAGVVTGATSISSTTFVGNVTGNVTGTAATVTDAAQANITSVGTLTGLTVDGNVTVSDGTYDFDIASHDGINGLKLDGTLVTASAAELNILDGVTATAVELNILDGVTATTAELNILDGVTATTAELNILGGVTATTAELNILDGVTATTAELNILDGVTASKDELNILGGVTATTAELNILDGVTATAAELNILGGVTATTAELNILDGVTATTAELNILDGVTASKDELNILDGIEATSATIGIGTDSPGSLLHLKTGDCGIPAGTTHPWTGTIFTIESDTHNTMNFLTPTNSDSNIYFGSSVTSAHGGIIYSHSDGFKFHTGGTWGSEALRIGAGNGNIELDPNGSGNVIIKGNATRGSGQIKLNCENNSHAITIKGPPHSANATYILTLPENDGDADQVLKTDGSGVLSWVAQSGGGGGGSSKWTDVGSGNIYRNSDVHIGGTTDPTVELQVTGSITATSDITAFSTSDSRLKENLQILENPLEAIAQISGYRFDWKGGFSEIHKNEGSDVGVIAHEVEAVLPEVVKNRDDGYKGVRYDKMVPLLIECIKELKKEVEELKRGRL
uniref:Peptidase S74 domain-containing protein n=1 Tax=viral metagenome TaxID=1070528 RepID=A0A6C0FD44_9ZZZZ